MTLATRCTACATVFRVVQDQLRVSEGWVRCGRCNQVFNAVDHLVDLSRAAPITPPATPHAEALSQGVMHELTQLRAADIPVPGETPLPSAAEEPVRVHFDLPTQRAEDEAPPIHIDDSERRSSEGPEALDTDPARSEADADLHPPPTFVQAADRAARWQQPRLRRGLVVAALGLALVLVLQLALEYRDLVAARWVGTRPLLDALCGWSGCRIEPPRWIEALAVDSSGLVRVEGTSTYRFSVVLHNRSAMALALPSIDLTLTDSQGRVIARRAFLASELGSAVTMVAASAELPLQATLSIAERPVAGYTIEIFYP